MDKLFINILTENGFWCNGMAAIQQDEDYETDILKIVISDDIQIYFYEDELKEMLAIFEEANTNDK